MELSKEKTRKEVGVKKRAQRNLSVMFKDKATAQQSDSDQTSAFSALASSATGPITDKVSPVPAPLHASTVPPSPRRQIASSEEESVAELGDVSEGECSVADITLEESGSYSSGDEFHRGLRHGKLPLDKVAHVVRNAVVKRTSSSVSDSTTEPKHPNQRESAPQTVLKTALRLQGDPKTANSTTSRSVAWETPKNVPPQKTHENAALNVEPTQQAKPSGDVKSCKVCSACGFGANVDHRPTTLPKFREPRICMWTSSHEANCPSEDRSSSLVNVLLQPLPPNYDSETQLPPFVPDYRSLIRLSLWSVIDGHGGGCVATYASEVLLPHIAASVSRALGCAIVDRGVCTVNGELRDANALDLDGLIKTSDRSLGNANSIQYRSPLERSDIDQANEQELHFPEDATRAQAQTTDKPIARLVDEGASEASSILPRSEVGASVSSVKTSVKTAASVANKDALVGTHSPNEVAAITRAITESFLAVDEGWINSIDPVATHQTSCQSNGRWNSGACALVVFTIQRLDWTNVSEPDYETALRGPEKTAGHDTSQNRDAARRRMIDYATRDKSASSLSTVSSTSSLTTEEAVNASGLESEITETEGEEDDAPVGSECRRRNPSRTVPRVSNNLSEPFISAPGSCQCHCFRAHDAILYTAHVGDCRAVMLGSAPPRTIKVRDSSTVTDSTDHPDTTDDESSHHSSDETECLSSSDHDADSSDDEDTEEIHNTKTPSYMTYMRRPVRRQSRRRDDSVGPFIALPPLENDHPSRGVEVDLREIERKEEKSKRGENSCKENSDSSTSSQASIDQRSIISLLPATRPIDLTTDHSAYNPAEVTAVLRRCNNAPRAISAGVGGGIKRVAGSLAVTRALGDAYLKTPLLSFLPYKSHAPYITARPEVNCRPVVKTGDKVLILATDGVWERASGEDVLRWVRNFYAERVAEAERRRNRRCNNTDRLPVASVDENLVQNGKNLKDFTEQEHEQQDDRNDFSAQYNSKKRDAPRSPSPPNKRRRISRRNAHAFLGGRSTVADVIVRRVLNKVRRARNISSLHALMSLPQGRARRSKHDDITASVVDLSAFVS